MNLDTLERLAQAATPGPWHTEGLHIVSKNRIWICSGHHDGYQPGVGLSPEPKFIAACSPDVILALVARVRALTEALEWLTNPGHDVGKSGGSAELGEIEQALEHAQKILTLTPSEPRNG